MIKGKNNTKKKPVKKYGHKRSKFEWDCMGDLCEIGAMQGIRQEYAGIPGRRFRFDFAWPERKVCLECQGVSWGEWGRHQSAPGVANDCEKFTLAMLHGWRVILITQKHLKSGEAMRWVKWALWGKGENANSEPANNLV